MAKLELRLKASAPLKPPGDVSQQADSVSLILIRNASFLSALS